VDTIRQQAAKELGIREEGKLKSLVFVYLCVKTVLDLENEDTFDCLTEGGGDFSVDALHISDEYDAEFTVSLFQAKYKNNLEGNSNFPEEGIKSVINAIHYLFNPSSRLEYIRPLHNMIVTIQVWLLTKCVAYAPRGKNPFLGTDKPFKSNFLQLLHITDTMSTP
jgi:hypothetical protein